ncbi:hypothetical protein ACOYR4_15430 [Acidovorax sp. M14]|uniref:hypothetical protein n=1 Tax=Acidovorax sp. M14 TaxID=3411354 RepID=UPI003BF48CFE
MPQSLPYPDQVSQSSTFKKVFNTKTTKFEDQYSQRMPAGINSEYWQASIRYEGMNATETAAILGALDAVGGWDYLLFDHQDLNQSNPLKWYVVSGYSLSYASGDLANISFELTQDF